MLKKLFLLLWFTTILLACEKNNSENGNSSEPLIYDSLVAKKEVVIPGETTTITASATGYKLEYHWSATAGDLLGGGPVVTYATSPCHVGVNTISCTVKDGNNKSETKSIKIVVE